MGTSPWNALWSRDFRLLWTSGAIGNICRWTEMVALLLLVLEMTDSVWWVALVGSMRMFPLLAGMFFGLIADRANRWYIMALVRSANVLIAAILVALILGGWINQWHILFATLAGGWAIALEQPSRHSFLYHLAGRRNAVRGMSLELVGVTLGLLVGPLMAGLFIEITGYTGTLIFVLTGYSLALLLNLMVKSRIANASAGTRSFRRTLVGGLQYSRDNRVVLGVLVVTLVLNFTGFSSIQLFPVVARNHLNVGEGLTGVLVSAFGMGTLLGAIVITLLGTVRYHGRVFVTGAALQLLGLVAFALSDSFVLSYFALLLFGLGGSAFATMQSTILLMSAAPDKRGMSIGLMDLCIGVGPIGTLQMGAVAGVLSTQQAIGIHAAAGLVLLVPIVFLTPLVWRPTTPDVEESTGQGKPSPDAQPRPDPVSKQAR